LVRREDLVGLLDVVEPVFALEFRLNVGVVAGGAWGLLFVLDVEICGGVRGVESGGGLGPQVGLIF
jgi:hypothetical protein